MHKNLLKPGLLLLFFATLFSVKASGQAEKTKFSQDPKFEQLLNEKRKINSSIAINDGYKIQIYSGDSDTSKRELNKFKADFSALDATIIFNTPSYKVWVGSFKSKIDAQRNLLEIQRRFPSSILVKPSR